MGLTSLGTWIRKGDKFGHHATFNYRKLAGFRTIIGGICSRLISIFIFIVLWTQIGAIIYKPRWNQITTDKYVQVEGGKSIETYRITPGQFVPTFTITTYQGDDVLINDDSLFDFYFENDHEEGTGERIAAISCYDYITGDIWANYTESEIENVLSLLPNQGRESLCPNASVYYLQGGVLELHSLDFFVDVKETFG